MASAAATGYGKSRDIRECLGWSSVTSMCPKTGHAVSIGPDPAGEVWKLHLSHNFKEPPAVMTNSTNANANTDLELLSAVRAGRKRGRVSLRREASLPCFRKVATCKQEPSYFRSCFMARQGSSSSFSSAYSAPMQGSSSSSFSSVGSSQSSTASRFLIPGINAPSTWLEDDEDYCYEEGGGRRGEEEVSMYDVQQRPRNRSTFRCRSAPPVDAIITTNTNARTKATKTTGNRKKKRTHRKPATTRRTQSSKVNERRSCVE